MSQNQTPAPPKPQYHTEWLCHVCNANGSAATPQKEDLLAAIQTEHAAKSPDCPSVYIATLPHVHAH